MRALLRESRTQDWRKVLSTVESYINNSPNPERNNLTSNQIFSGRESSSVYHLHQSEELVTRHLLEHGTDGELLWVVNKLKDSSFLRHLEIHLEKLKRELQNIDEHLTDKLRKRRAQQRERNNVSIGMDEIQYSVGDWVLWSRK